MSSVAPTTPVERPPLRSPAERGIRRGTPSRTNAFVAVVPVRRHRLWLLRTSMMLLGHLPSRGLDRLSIIHFGQWGLLRRAAPTGRRRRPQLRNTLVFTSSYDGDRDDYIVALSRGIRLAFRGVFGQCTDFPGVTPSGRLLGYVEQYRYEPTFFWSAYADATLRDIREALRLAPRLDALAADAATAAPAAVRAAFAEVAAELQYGSLAARRTPWPKLAWQVLTSPRATGTLTSLLPIRAGREGDVRQAIEALAALDGAAFAPVAGTHFARLAVIDHLRDPGNRPLTFEPCYLLLSVQFDGDRATYLRRLRDAPDELFAVLAHCESSTGAPFPCHGDALALELERARVPNGLFVTGAGGRTVDAIRDALRSLFAIRDVALRAGDLTDVALRDALRRELFP